MVLPNLHCPKFGIKCCVYCYLQVESVVDTQYTAQDVSRLLDTSWSDSSASTDDENSSDNDQSDFDLSDPEAMFQDMDSSAIVPEPNETNSTLSVFTSIQISDNQPRADGYQDDNHMILGHFQSSKDVSPNTEASRGINFSHGRDRARSRTRQRGRQCQRGDKRGRRGQGRGSRSQGSDHGQLVSLNQEDTLPVTSIRVKTDRPKEVFPFTPAISPDFCLPDGTDTSDPKTLFKLFFGADIVQYICKASDEYAESLKDNRTVTYKYYKSMTPDDFLKVVGILIHFGYKEIPNYRLAWCQTSLYYDPFVVKTMSRNRFEGLMYFLYVVSQVDEQQFKDDKDKLAKVHPLSDHINANCQLYCQPEKELSIDERMVRSKARFSFKQYIRNKPTKWGITILVPHWLLICSV